MEEQESKKQFEKNLITFLKLFHNRPLHLAKYFLENDSFSDKFKKNVLNSKKLEEMNSKYEFIEMSNMYFLNFKDMLRFFDNISNEFNLDNLDDEKVTNHINLKLDELIKSENYEEAIKIRDFMIQNNIKRKN
jgi:hypothetical protein